MPAGATGQDFISTDDNVQEMMDLHNADSVAHIAGTFKVVPSDDDAFSEQETLPHALPSSSRQCSASFLIIVAL